MSKNCRRKCVKSVVYFVCVSNIVGGACSIITRGIAPLGGLFLMLGLLAIAGGLLLLVGVLKENARFILVYLILAIMVMAFTTVLISVLIIPKVKELKVYIFVVVYLLLIIWWPILYCVYVFYKDLLGAHVATFEDPRSEPVPSDTTTDSEKPNGCEVTQGTSQNTSA